GSAGTGRPSASRPISRFATGASDPRPRPVLGDSIMTTPRKARLGFLGAGWWATANHMPLLAQRDDVELAAVCRLGRPELRQLQEHFGFPLATESAAELVNYPGLDAVLVSSPP